MGGQRRARVGSGAVGAGGGARQAPARGVLQSAGGSSRPAGGPPRPARPAGTPPRPAGTPARPARIPSRGSLPRGEVAAIQRSRLLIGALGAIEEYGYAHATVGRITARAGISRRTFYELFENREACLAALFEDIVGIVEREIAAAGLEGLAWRERVRRGLWVILCLLDREPALARVCVIEALRSGAGVLERREAVLARLAGVLDEGRGEGPRGAQCTALTAEGLVGAALAIVHARLLRRERAPLTDLFGELMGLLVLPYLGPAAARREQARPAPGSVSAASAAGMSVGLAGERDPLAETPMRLTYRTARVLESIASQPGASNRVVGEHAGISDPGQISKLLRRLEGLGLMVNTGGGHLSGEPNAWGLTPLGAQVAQRLNIDTRHTTTEGSCLPPSDSLEER
jgi:AcrR family transcriptional regulator